MRGMNVHMQEGEELGGIVSWKSFGVVQKPASGGRPDKRDMAEERVKKGCFVYNLV